MTQNNEINEKLVHVNSYTKDDGTKVREHWRGKNTNSNVSSNIFDDLIVNNTHKTVMDWGGNIFSSVYGTKEAFNLYKIASPNYNFNTDYIQKNGQLFNSTSELGDKKLEQKIKARLFLENTGMNDCKVFVADETSSISQKIANSNELKSIIKNDIDFIRKLHLFPAVGSDIEFTSPDLYNALHGANITEAKFDEQGNLNIKIEDLYNFNKGRTSVRGRLGEKLQNKGDLIPYYLQINVKIPKSELDKY